MTNKKSIRELVVTHGDGSHQALWGIIEYSDRVIVELVETLRAEHVKPETPCAADCPVCDLIWRANEMATR